MVREETWLVGFPLPFKRLHSGLGVAGFQTPKLSHIFSVGPEWWALVRVYIRTHTTTTKRHISFTVLREKAFWLAKQNGCSDTFLIGKLDVIGLKAIRCWKKKKKRTGGWEPCHLSPWLTMQWRKPVTKHKNSLELPGRAAYLRQVCTVGPCWWSEVMSRSLREMEDLKQRARGRGFQRRAAGARQSPEASLQLSLHLLCVRALRLVPFPLADGICILHHQLIHPRQGFRKQHGALKEAQVAPVQRQHKHDVLPFLWKGFWNG